MNTVKESRDISRGEARFIQYTKILMGIVGLILLGLLVMKIEYIAV